MMWYSENVLIFWSRHRWWNLRWSYQRAQSLCFKLAGFYTIL